MKKMTMIFLVLTLLLTLVVAVAPVAAGSGNPGGGPDDDGPPGWSIVNPGQGGSPCPGAGSCINDP